MTPEKAPRLPRVSVIVVNRDKKDLLAACLESLRAQTFRDFETVVVDNGSRDGSAEMIRSIEGPDLKAVLLPGNTGFAGGANAGLKASRGVMVATINNDAVADPGWLGKMVTVMDSAPRIGMCACKIVFLSNPGILDKAGHLIYPDGLNHGRGSGEMDSGQYDKEEEALFPDAAGALYRREMIDETGFFEPAFFAYGDDCDLGLRGRWAGWDCAYVPGAIVRHVHSATAGEFSAFKAFLIERNRIWVAVRNFPAGMLFASPWYTLLRLAFHAAGALLGIGSSGKFAAGSGKLRLAAAVIRAYASAAAGLPAMLKSRRSIMRSRKISSQRFKSILFRHRIGVRALTWGS